MSKSFTTIKAVLPSEPARVSATQRLDALCYHSASNKSSLVSSCWSALPLLRASHTPLAGTALIATVHLNPSAGVVGRNRFSLLSRGQPIKYFRPAAFAQRTGKARPLFVEPVEPYIWRGQLGIEPTQKVLETSSPSLEHSPPYSRSSRLSCGFLRLSACLFERVRICTSHEWIAI